MIIITKKGYHKLITTCFDKDFFHKEYEKYWATQIIIGQEPLVFEKWIESMEENKLNDYILSGKKSGWDVFIDF